MLQTLKLLVPALIPSWRFFDVIAPSPRIEFTLLKTAQDADAHWQEFRPRPAHLPIRSMLKRLLWNPRWNASLFLVSCAERLMQNPTEHSREEIRRRIQTELARNNVDAVATPYLQFRLVFIARIDAALQRHIAYLSPVYRCAERADA